MGNFLEGPPSMIFCPCVCPQEGERGRERLLGRKVCDPTASVTNVALLTPNCPLLSAKRTAAPLHPLSHGPRRCQTSSRVLGQTPTC